MRKSGGNSSFCNKDKLFHLREGLKLRKMFTRGFFFVFVFNKKYRPKVRG